MFTGLIEYRARIAERELRGNAGKLTLRLDEPLENSVPGESVAVNGACLTLERSEGSLLVFHVLEETFKRTNLGSLPLESLVNVERAMKSGERFGGHFVSGHIDATVEVLAWSEIGDDIALTISVPAEFQSQVIPKGSVSIDGVSLTIASLSVGALTVHLIPTTLDETALRE
ncbi:MAG: riboflavin synthase, partial [Victivallales bacterium]|nr:riboflavin synthase [Victivallales bacterium]